jgi:hypothetical protein
VAAFNDEKAATIVEGPEAFKAWALGVAAKGYASITSLKQTIANDQTRAKVAMAASDDLDAFVSQFCNLSNIGL